ncbi:MAG: hypothetical protein ACRDGS_16760 [Chloroflexota bacterium]
MIWRAPIYIAQHVYLLLRSGQLRFRLETYGLYYPSEPYARKWWRISPRVLALLLRQSREYATWIVEMNELRRAGPEGWWETYRSRMSKHE